MAGVGARPLRHQPDGRDHKNGDDSGCSNAALIKATIRIGLGKKIAEGRAEWPGQKERQLEQKSVGRLGEEVGGGDKGDCASEYYRAARVAESGVVGQEVTESGA